MKIKKTRLKELLAGCDEGEDLVMQEVDPTELRALVKEVLKHRKRAKRLKPLRRECAFLRQYVEDCTNSEMKDRLSSDRLDKYEHAVQEAAIIAILGDHWYPTLNELL